MFRFSSWDRKGEAPSAEALPTPLRYRPPVGTELEIKAPALPDEALDPDDVLAALAGRATLLGPVTVTELDARYHDDPAGLLRAAGWTLRARREGERIVGTAKGPGGLVDGVRQRAEFEVPLAALPAEGAPLPDALAAVLPLDRWPPCAHRAVVRRTAVELALPGCTAELAIDHGRVEAGGRSSPVREVELELRDGEPAALLDAALMLAAQLGVRPGGWAKAARGMALLGKLRAPTLPPSPTLLDRWEQLVDLEDRLRAGEDRWTAARKEAVEALVALGAPAALAQDSERPRVRIDAPEHAALLWGLYVAAIRRGASEA
jgi:triphosphatase